MGFSNRNICGKEKGNIAEVSSGLLRRIAGENKSGGEKQQKFYGEIRNTLVNLK